MHTHAHSDTHAVAHTRAHAKQNGFELLRELLELGHEAVGNGLPYVRPLR